VPARTARRPSCWCAPPIASRRKRPCTRASASASRRHWPACKGASRGPRSRSRPAPPSARSDACWGATHAPRRAIKSASSRIPPPPPGCGLHGRCGPNGTSGRARAKAAACCAPTSPTGHPRTCGAPTSSCPRRRPPSASTRASCRSVRSGTSARTGCWRTSWCASSPTCCGRRWSNGRAAPGWATPPAPSSKSSRPSRAPTSSCQRRGYRNASCVCAAGCVPTAPKPHSSSASAY